MTTESHRGFFEAECIVVFLFARGCVLGGGYQYPLLCWRRRVGGAALSLQIYGESCWWITTMAMAMAGGESTK